MGRHELGSEAIVTARSGCGDRPLARRLTKDEARGERVITGAHLAVEGGLLA